MRFRWNPSLPRNELEQCLLSANLSLLEGDRFDRLGSSLKPSQVHHLLARRLDVSSKTSFEEVLADRTRNLGAATFEESEAYEAFAGAFEYDSRFESEEDGVLDPDAVESLSGICGLLRQALESRTPATKLSAMHFTSMARDIQKAAFLVRLGLAAGYLGMEDAGIQLKFLQSIAAARYASWTDFSLSGILGMAMCNRRNAFVAADWKPVLQSHFVVAKWDVELPIRFGSSQSAPQRINRRIESGSTLELEWADVAS
ncbi:hypothetical protein VARIO8X_120115 [Burkholderiales bacterium 8X]|nr:hypothetical protein VARIO8X_120115 [Burkholderiales bacterium 8X]